MGKKQYATLDLCDRYSCICKINYFRRQRVIRGVGDSCVARKCPMRIIDDGSDMQLRTVGDRCQDVRSEANQLRNLQRYHWKLNQKALLLTEICTAVPREAQCPERRKDPTMWQALSSIHYVCSQGGAKLFSCPGRHLTSTSVRPCRYATYSGAVHTEILRGRQNWLPTGYRRVVLRLKIILNAFRVEEENETAITYCDVIFGQPCVLYNWQQPALTFALSSSGKLSNGAQPKQKRKVR